MRSCVNGQLCKASQTNRRRHDGCVRRAAPTMDELGAIAGDEACAAKKLTRKSAEMR